MIQEFTTYIENNTSFTIGTDLFALSTEPLDPDECIVVDMPIPGLANGILTDYRQIPLRIHARALTRITAWENINVVFTAIHGVMQVNLPVVGAGSTYRCNIVCDTPGFNGLDETKRRHQFVMPVSVTVSNIL